MITKFKIFENMSTFETYENLVGIELSEYHAYDDFDVSLVLSDFNHIIERYFNDDESEYSCAENLIDREYLIKYHDMHTGIYNVMSFKEKSDAINTLKYISENHFDMEDDLDEIFHYVQDLGADGETYEINYREIETIDLQDYYDNNMILDESDIKVFENAKKEYEKSMKAKDFNL